MSKAKKVRPPQASRESKDAAYVALRDAEDNVSATDSEKPYKSKLHAVELALEDLGWDAMPARIHKYLMDNYKLDMSAAHIGVNKTTILRRRGITPGAPGTASAKTTATVRAVRGPKPSRGASYTAEDIRTVKALLETHDESTILAIADVVVQVGGDKFRELVGLVH